MIKFPKTPRIINVLKEDVHTTWKHLNAVVQEKVDGANSGISFDENGKLLLQSRGHYLVGGPRERQFDLFKQWANENVEYLFNTLEDKYVLFGEWLYAKHHIFYDALDSYFLGYDLFDKQENKFLSLPRYKALLENGPVYSVPVLHQDKFSKINNFIQYIGKSKYKTTNWKEKLIQLAGEKELQHSDMSDLMEGVYVRVEDENWVVGRMKHPRENFTKIINDDSHWLTRSIVQNLLRS